jgi:hypothetical protein
MLPFDVVVRVRVVFDSNKMIAIRVFYIKLLSMYIIDSKYDEYEWLPTHSSVEEYHSSI